MQLSVIIVSYNVKYFLEQCLHSVEAACKNIDAEILVVDNASTDNSIEYLQPKFSSVKFIKNDLNEGFAKANNRALRFATCKYVLYLNPDTIVGEDSFLNAVSFLDEHNEAGAVGVKLVDGSGNFLPESKRSFPSVIASFFKMSGLATLFPRSKIFNHYALGNLDENKIHEVNVLPGAFLMVRRNILLQLNGYDEDFFMYGEDIDLSYRIQQSGYKNYYLGNNTIIHFKGESAQTNKAAYVINFYDAMKIFVHKHYKRSSALFLNTTIILSRSIAAVKHNSASSEKEKKDVNFLLIGDDEGTTSAEKIISVYNFSIRKTDSFQLDTATSKKINTAVVFCMHNFSYAETISFIQKNKNKFACFWHHSKSQSIVGSSSSKTAGEIYATS